MGQVGLKKLNKVFDKFTVPKFPFFNINVTIFRIELQLYKETPIIKELLLFANFVVFSVRK